jgi:hypothetical protein
MADFNLLDIQPHQVSRDMRGYSVFFYGEPKSGKTTTATKFPHHLLLAFEKGYNAIPGAMAQPINSWSEFRKVLRQLKDPKVHEKFETIIIDTADIAYDYCEKFICANNDADAIGDIPYGKGYGLVEKEFDTALRSIVQMNYGLVIISHSVDKTFTDEAGNEFNKIVPTLDKRGTKVVSRMADIIGYSRGIEDKDGSTVTKLFIRGTSRFMAGSRFTYTPEHIDFSYNNLVQAICDAIDKEAAEKGEEFFTEKRNNLYTDTVADLDFDEMMKEFGEIVINIPGSSDAELATKEGVQFKDYWQPRITQIIERYLGKGHKVKDCTRDQVEALDLILTDLRELVQTTPPAAKEEDAETTEG